MKFLSEGSWRFFEKSKLTKRVMGFVFKMTGKMRGFSIPEVLAWYAESLSLRDGD